MSIPLDEVTPETPCPERLSQVHHYPFTKNGELITMPGPDSPPTEVLVRPVMFALCTTTRRPVYLIPPRTRPNPDTPPTTMCPECLYQRVQDLLRVKEQLAAAS
jgi:hypothetical protein